MPEITKASIVDSVQFYSNGTERGMSQTGLGRFVGVSEMAIRKLLKSTSSSESKSKYLTPFNGKTLTLDITTGHNATILSSEVCAAIVKYYAFEANGDNSVARSALEKFMEIGINTFIDDTTGYVKPATVNATELADVMAMLLNLNQKIDIIQSDNLKFKKATVSSPGLEKLVELTDKYYEEGDQHLLAPAPGQELTLREWLKQEMKMTLEDKPYRQLALKVAETFKVHQEEKPRQVVRMLENKSPVKVYVYSRRAYPLMRLCLTQVLSQI